jgi:2-oxoglutarate ferredoxin oxidoreductase subunit beta
MGDKKNYDSTDPIAWCPGCGNFGILNAIKEAFADMETDPADVLLVSGIGQAAKLPHYIKCNCFNGLHGRALPVALGARAANKDLKIIVTTGDGDCYGEGGNHLIHNIRRNPDITVIVHNNQIYGLTKGQASPTTDTGYRTPVQTEGVELEPLHALSMAIVLGAPFVARGFTKEKDQLQDLIKKAVKHRGFSLLEVLRPCVSFNKKNTYKWYSDRVYDVGGEGYDPSDRKSAVEKAREWGEKIPLGVLYEEPKKTFLERYGFDTELLTEVRKPDVGALFDELV